MPRERMTADDLDDAVKAAVLVLGTHAGEDWSLPAGGVTWSCTRSVEHIVDVLIGYAIQLSARAQDGFVRLVRRSDDLDTAPALVDAVATTGAVLLAVVRVTPPDVRAYHLFGLGDVEGYAAMAAGETLIHTYDVTTGLGADFSPPPAVCAKIVARHFPSAPTGGDPWQTLLGAVGRVPQAGETVTRWRWHPAPLDD